MQTQTLIIGAGLSGLALADRLQHAKEDYLVLEARARLGGRIHTKTVTSSLGQSNDFDLGPAWFWPGQPMVASLAQRFGLNVFEQYASGDLMYEDRHGQPHRGMGFASMEGSYRMDGGLTGLIKNLAKGLPEDRLHLSTRVVAITKKPDGLEVRAITGEREWSILAQSVVLAIPPRVAMSKIVFTPALPQAAQRALSDIATWMAGQAKIMAVYERPFWREQGLSGDAMSQKGPMVEIHDASPAQNGPYALFGFVGVPDNVRLARADEIVRLARDQLVRLFGPDMQNPLSITLQDWAGEEWTATASDQTPIGYHPAYHYPPQAEGLWDGRLLFGSTEVASQFGGYIEGALVAAKDAQARLARQRLVAAS
jgi:monoamine oxidase